MAKTGIPFGKMLSRPPLLNTKTVAYLNNNSVVLDNIMKYESKNSKFKAVASPNFRNFKSRESKDPRMPLFMDGITSRLALNTLNRKMLETNHFDESYFFARMQEGEKMYRTAGAEGFFKSNSQQSKFINVKFLLS